MNSFISCPNCSRLLHESASDCPACGTPNEISSADSKTIHRSYAEIPWYRKRWFAVVCAVVFIPLLVVIAFTGDIYFPKNGEVKTFPKYYKFFILAIFIGMVILNLIPS